MVAGIFNAGIFNNAVFNTGTVEAPAPSAPPSGGGYVPRVPHRWPREQKRKKKLYEEFEDAIQEIAERAPEVREAAAAVIGVPEFDVGAMEARIEHAIIVADARNEIDALRRKLKVLEDLIDDDDVETLILH